MKANIDTAVRESIHHRLIQRNDIFNLLLSTESLEYLFHLDSPLPPDRVSRYLSIYKQTGNTPVHRTELSNGNILYTKLEYKNKIGGNHYGRFWIIYLFIAESLGLISPGKDDILEVTTGSSGVSLAQTCFLLGYNSTIVVPKIILKSKLDLMQLFKARVIQSDGYVRECIDLMLATRTKSKKYFMANHAEEKANIITNVFRRIAIEYLSKFPIPNKAILAIGNGSSIEGIYSHFQEVSKNSCDLVGYHPDFSNEYTKPIFGLLPPYTCFRHVSNIAEVLNHIEYTNQYSIEDIRKNYSYDLEIQKWGDTSIYALGIANKLSCNVYNETFFSVAYDRIE